MRLLVVSQYFWPENFRINDLVSELVRRGHDVTVLTGYPNYPDGKIFDDFSDTPLKFSSYQGATVVRVPMFARGQGGLRLVLNYASFAIMGSTIGVWRLRGRPFDAIFVFEPSPITVGIPAVAMRALRRIPIAFWVLDLWPETLSAVGAVRRKWVLRLVEMLVGYIYRRCDLILAQSRSFIPQIARHLGGQDRVVYFPGWAEAEFTLDRVEPAPEIATAQGVFNVMFAGNIGDAQDFPAILDAAERLRENSNIRWLIVGDGRAARWVATEVGRRGLQKSVQLLGRYPIHRMPSFYRHADALLVSLKNDPIFAMTIPGKLQSYLAAGIPVIAMLDGEGGEVVRSAGAGLDCAAGDSVGLAAAVLALSRMPTDARAEMGRNGLAVSRREFDRATLIGKLEQLIESMTSASIFVRDRS